MDEPLVPFIEFHSNQMSSQEFFHLWRESVESFFDALPEDEESYRGMVRVCVLGDVLLFETAFDNQQFKRDRKRILTFDNDLLIFQIYTKGSCEINNGNNSFIAQPNAAVILDMGLSIQSDAEYSHVYSLVIPRPLLAKYMPNTNNLNKQLSAPGDTKTLILRQAIESVLTQLPNIKMSDGPVIGTSLVSLMASLLIEGLSEQTLTDSAGQAVLDSICDYIEQHLALPDLGPPALLRTFPLSRSSLYRLFQSLGGVDNYIRERRLHRCYLDLKSPEQLHRKVIDIATFWGFSNQSSFSRLFKQRYGVKPSEVRYIAQIKQKEQYQMEQPDEPILDNVSQIKWWSRQIGS